MIRRRSAGVTYTVRGHTLHQVSRGHAEAYDRLMEDGLYDALTAEGDMVSHVERGLKYALTDDAYRVIQAKPVTETTYPYEWSFSGWRQAALHVLDVAEMALDAGMMLQDASVYSVQLEGGRPVWTDALAFSVYEAGMPWPAYQQFVGQYLGPLALMANVDASLGGLLLLHPAGLPPALASALLPARTRINFGLAAHIHQNTRAAKMQPMEQRELVRLFDDLRETLNSLSWEPQTAAPTAPADVPAKQRLLRDYFGMVQTDRVWDLHAGAGAFSRLAAGEYGAATLAFNPTPDATEHLWRELATEDDAPAHLLPLTVDWMNPTPGTGWANREQRSIAARGTPDMLLAFDWVHRLALGEGVRLTAVAAALSQLAPHLVIEFVPRNDPQSIAMLERDSDAHDEYTQDAFEAAFGGYYDVMRADDVPDSRRRLYLMKVRG